MKSKKNNFVDLTVDDANYIQNNRVTSQFQIFEKDFGSRILADVLINSFVEVPPQNLTGKEELKIALSGIDATTIQGRLQWMYLTTYWNSGRVFYQLVESGLYEVRYDFTQGDLSTYKLNRENPKITIDGHKGFLHIDSFDIEASKLFELTPSISINITIDDKQVLFESLVHMATKKQEVFEKSTPKFYHGFGTMEVSLIFNSENIDNDIFVLIK